jgi:hypothetical protein
VQYRRHKDLNVINDPAERINEFVLANLSDEGVPLKSGMPLNFEVLRSLTSTDAVTFLISFPVIRLPFTAGLYAHGGGRRRKPHHSRSELPRQQRFAPTKLQ